MSIRKAVIPIAGLGTRLFPASHACKKELFPIVGPDGIARALLHYQLIDLVNTGIDQICIVVRPGEEQVVADYLKGPGKDYLSHIAQYPSLVKEAQQMRAILDRLTFAVQREQEGYGHAVYQSREFASGEPVLLCLGDHLFRGGERPCHAQLIEAFAACGGKSVSAVNRIHASELKGYGAIAGKRPGRCFADYRKTCTGSGSRAPAGRWPGRWRIPGLVRHACALSVNLWYS